jgi:hypothetical protein
MDFRIFPPVSLEKSWFFQKWSGHGKLSIHQDITMQELIKELKNLRRDQYERINLATVYFQTRGFKYMGDGRCRITFLHPNRRYVIKAPISGLGFEANREEHKIWHKYKSLPDQNGIYYAPCRLIQNTLLMMWRVDFVEYEDRPDWSGYIDCDQVGSLADGRMVAYDYQRN